MMFGNVGILDRILRFSIAAVLLYLGQVTYSGDPLGLGLTIASAIAGVTAIVGFCPLYRLLGTSTRTDT
ncbi:hypothetical protein CKA32_004978 [Geitlerinema sp. FC II]|uniref:YgaP family membrane protein n=1 Tax=Baaleninema simplex TaxID=2862350 RepID=UPI000349399E|nr:DUF2892 domain-containing protein [Baaleninema simplex]MDC0835044.1 DUF2892 domain-containing protein [Geitlerinema sp. CS-897]PPT05476.1 hypothetical protein CKA32_004978 [Geitlerinema sp. FC II]